MDPKCCLCHSTVPLLQGRGFGREMGCGDGMRGARFVGYTSRRVEEFWGKWVAGGLGGDTRHGAGWM